MASSFKLFRNLFSTNHCEKVKTYDPRAWGPHKWIFLHMMAENYYENPYLKSNITQKITDTSFETDYKTYLKTKKDVSKNINLKKKKKSTYSFIWTIYRIFPILSWFPQYRWRKYLKDDIVAGITVGLML